MNFCVTAELPSHMVLGMPALSPTMVRYMGKELILKHLLFFFVVGFSLFCTKARLHSCVLLCRLKVTLQNGGRKKEIRSVIFKKLIWCESLKLLKFQFDIIINNGSKKFSLDETICWFHLWIWWFNLTDWAGWCSMRNRDRQSYPWVWKSWRGVILFSFTKNKLILYILCSNRM